MSNTINHFKENSIVKITIHYCDLKPEKLLVQPIVCMHVVDSIHGSYVKKQDRERAVTSFYETQRNDIDYIMPILTQPCTNVGKRSQLLSWEESFILNENLNHLQKKEISTVLFFEIIDLVPLSFTKYHYERLNENGMQKLAWAFLKILGPNNIINTGRKLRLQLYKSHISQKKKTSQLEVFLWWSTKSRTPLPASLYISFEQSNMLSMEPALRSMLPLQEEIAKPTRVEGSGICNESTHLNLDDTHSILEDNNADVKWLRKEGEPFEIPEQLSLSLESVSCQNLKFSSLGRILVAGCGSLGQHFLLFYEIPSGKTMHKIIAHSDVIYDLDWSEDDECLLSASADYCVKLWNTKSWNLSSTFIHPSFVYSAKFQPALKNILVTGCYDHVIRIWTYNKTVQLLQELEGHNAAVNTLCWFRKSMKLFSADDAGDIKVWKIPSHQKTGKRGFEKYVLDKELSFREIKGISVSKIVTSSSEDVLFLFCGDNSVYLVDPSVESNFTCYESVQKTAVSGCCSPCGNLLFLHNDDECVLVWRRKTLKIATILQNTFSYCHLTSMDYHPLDHILALSTSESRIYVYTYNDSDKQLDNEEHGTSRNNLKEKIYEYDADTSVEEGLAKLSFNALNIKRNSPNNVEKLRYENSREGSGNPESFSAVTTKFGELNELSVFSNHSESDNIGSENQATKFENPNVVQKSSKRSLRRKRQREMCVRKSKITF